MTLREDAASRFSDLVDVYAKYRFREYPSKVLDVMFHGLGDPRKLVVADAGAGSGISSTFIATRGCRVIAIEPNALMRASAPEHPLVQWRDGTAEATGLPDRSVDVAAAFQAFHWFDPAAALGEFRRIARHRIVSVQYEHEESDPASAEFGSLLRAFSVDDSEALRRHALETFASHAGSGMRTAILDVDWRISLHELLGYVASISFVPHKGVRARELSRQAEFLFGRYAKNGVLNLPLRLYVLALDT
ncbi:MAG TPA: class I SAM-dependent methyltransferase [Candidatus Baltobacteraceae bacterium]|nr:class I SAM-dependent methyltransferase [Candidatus Baltobacteraceae bacterium]